MIMRRKKFCLRDFNCEGDFKDDCCGEKITNSKEPIVDHEGGGDWGFNGFNDNGRNQ